MYEEEKYRPLSPWAYFGYGLLFGIPVVGLVLLIIFAITAKNINLKNYARSYFCQLALALVIVGVIIILTTLGILGDKTFDFIRTVTDKAKIF